MTPDIWDGLIKLAALIGVCFPLAGITWGVIKLVFAIRGFCDRVELKIDKLTEANVTLCESISSFADRMLQR